MGLGEFVILGFCVWQVVEIWHHSDIFANMREQISYWKGTRFTRWLSELLGCPWCLSVWIGFIVAGLWCSEQTVVRVVIVGFAVSRLANVLNDLTHPYHLTPNSSGGFRKKYTHDLQSESVGTSSDSSPEDTSGDT